jgi:hypothetical protein
MGQSYRGTPAEFIDDAMYKAPYELIGKVIEKKDREINDTIDGLMAYNEKLKADVLEEDSPQTRSKIQEYQQRIDNTIQTIQSDPMNYNLQLGEIKSLSRDITKDWDPNGYMGTMIGNKQSFLAEKARIAKEVEAGRLEPHIAEIEEARIREKYRAQGGLKWNSEAQRAENGLSIQDQYYKVDFDEKFLTHMKPDEYSKEWDSLSGMYIFTHKRTGKNLTKEDIINTYLTQVGADTETQYAAQRYRELGGEGDLPGYEGITDFNNAVRYEKVKGKDGVEYNVLKTNPDNYWGRQAQAAAETFEQKSTGVSDTRSVNSWAVKEFEIKNEEGDDIIIDANVVLGKKNYSATSSANTWATNNAGLANLKSQMSNLAKQNGLKEGSAEYNAIMSGDETAIRTFFTDPTTANKFITQFNDINMELNVQKAAVNNFNKTFSKELKALGKGNEILSEDPSEWTPAQQKLYNEEMKKQKVKVGVTGTATFGPANLNKATKTEVKKATSGHILTGTGTFESLQGLPSLKLGGSRVRYLNENNKTYTSDLSPKRKVSVTYNGKQYYFDKYSADNTYSIPDPNSKSGVNKTVKVRPTDVLVTLPVKGDPSLNLYAQNGHINQSAKIEGTAMNGQPIYGYTTMENGKAVTITVDEDNTAPSMFLDNEKQNFIKSNIKVGSFSSEVHVKGISTENLDKVWAENYEQSNIETTKMKYGSMLTTDIVPYNEDTNAVIENGEYYLISDTRKELITDPEVKLRMDKKIFYKRN